MAKIFVQDTEEVLSASSALAINGTVSGSAHCRGYAKLVGIACTNASSTASGIRIQQSSNYGANWDIETLYTITACTGSTFSVDITGNAVRVSASNGATAASLVRMWFGLRPI